MSWKYFVYVNINKSQSDEDETQMGLARAGQMVPCE